ncbi:hypothetical protein LK994_07740 [Ferruginibacter lapsinanis]|uniref:hypothetical protein n=1 Tax=Ferruginibacter lapsinanis TaxID=563172 RepID=UPI001E3457A8|nr:hypothetical protein [Ferruginibacter lapsinanis]UEG48526.1 hypothetical protein LK994_07740 [Ferruginibacter lapsinanis]
MEPFILQDLYKKTLVEESVKKVQAPESPTVLSFLGNNKKGIAIVVESNNSLYLPDEELNFLLGILSACKLSMEDVAVLNIDKNNSATYQTIATSLDAHVVLIFGINCEQIALPLQFPHYQIQSYNNQVYLSSPTLNAIRNDKVEKTKLWNCLKQIFSIA